MVKKGNFCMIEILFFNGEKVMRLYCYKQIYICLLEIQTGIVRRCGSDVTGFLSLLSFCPWFFLFCNRIWFYLGSDVFG